jgi:hypothetical protein
LRTAPLAWSVSVRAQPGSIAPLWSVTVPSISPVVFWANDNGRNVTKETARTAMSFNMEPIDPSGQNGLIAGFIFFARLIVLNYLRWEAFNGKRPCIVKLKKRYSRENAAYI